MKKYAGLAAIVLWLMTAVAIGIVFVRGRTAPGSDGRTAVLLHPAERDYVLSEMRSLLGAVREITAGLAESDLKRIRKAASAVGMAGAHDAAPTLLAKLPLGFKQMAMPLHAGFDDLAAAAERGEPTAALAGRLIEQLDRCSACHESFRIDAEP